MSDERRAPFEPPTLTAPPGTGGELGAAPEDFRVDEVPLYAFSGAGPHLYVRLEKRGWTTPDAVDALARAAQVNARDVGVPGMKDRWAVTTQWLSVPESATPPESWTLPEGLRVLEVTRHQNKLRTGHLAANRFQVRLLHTRPDALATATATAERLTRKGLPNYYGPQRFGHRLENVERALAWLAREGRGRPIKPFQAKLYASVLQAEVFNRILARRIELGLEKLFVGETVRLAGSSRIFTVEDPERELPRLAARELALVAPIVGPKARAKGELAALEADALAEVGLDEPALARLGRFGEGTWRELVVWPEGLTVEAEPEALVVAFTLPSGSYATQLLRELTHRPWAEPRREPPREAAGPSPETRPEPLD